MYSRLLAVVSCLLGLFVQAAFATTWFIKPDSTGDVLNIQEGVQRASSGDTLLLAAGTFTGPGNYDIRVTGKPLFITSTLGRDSTILQCWNHRGFEIFSVTSAPLVISGITIRDASLGNSGEETNGEGLYVSNSFLRIEDSAIVGCGGDWTISGAGMAAYNSNVELVRTKMSGNFAPYGGGGHIYMRGGNLLAKSTEFRSGSTFYADEGGGGIYIGPLTNAVITGCYFAYNNTSRQCCGGAIYSEGSLVIKDCRFDDNYSDGGAAVFGSVDSLLNSVFHNNTTEYGYRGTVLWGDAEYIGGNWFVQNYAYDGPQTSSIFEGTIGTFENNILVHDGWYMSVLEGSAGIVRGNTFFLAGSPEDAHERFLLSDTTSFSNNIIYDAVSGSVVFDGPGGAKVACSDTYVPAGSLGPAFVDQGGNTYADPRFCEAIWDSDFSLTTASPCIPENSLCGTLIGVKRADCTECPPDTTLDAGARRLIRFPLLNPSNTAVTCFYTVECEQGLQLVDDSNPGVFTTTVVGVKILAPHETATVPVWVLVNADAPPGDSLRVWISQTFLGTLSGGYGCETMVTVSGVSVSAPRAALHPTLSQNWPNPFNPNTTIAFTVPVGSGAALLTVYDVAGRAIRRFGDYPPGIHTARWDGRNGGGSPVASGLYLYRLEGVDFSITRKMVLLR